MERCGIKGSIDRYSKGEGSAEGQPLAGQCTTQRRCSLLTKVYDITPYWLQVRTHGSSSPVQSKKVK